MILGIGLDIVETARVRQLLDDHDQRFEELVFTPAERGECAGRADKVQALIRIPRPGGLALAAALRQAQAARTARKDTGQVRVQLNPADLI